MSIPFPNKDNWPQERRDISEFVHTSSPNAFVEDKSRSTRPDSQNNSPSMPFVNNNRRDSYFPATEPILMFAPADPHSSPSGGGGGETRSITYSNSSNHDAENVQPTSINGAGAVLTQEPPLSSLALDGEILMASPASGTTQTKGHVRRSTADNSTLVNREDSIRNVGGSSVMTGYPSSVTNTPSYASPSPRSVGTTIPFEEAILNSIQSAELRKQLQERKKQNHRKKRSQENGSKLEGEDNSDAGGFDSDGTDNTNKNAVRRGHGIRSIPSVKDVIRIDDEVDTLPPHGEHVMPAGIVVESTSVYVSPPPKDDPAAPPITSAWQTMRSVERVIFTTVLMIAGCVFLVFTLTSIAGSVFVNVRGSLNGCNRLIKHYQIVGPLFFVFTSVGYCVWCGFFVFRELPRQLMIGKTMSGTAIVLSTICILSIIGSCGVALFGTSAAREDGAEVKSCGPPYAFTQTISIAFLVFVFLFAIVYMSFYSTLVRRMTTPVGRNGTIFSSVTPLPRGHHNSSSSSHPPSRHLRTRPMSPNPIFEYRSPNSQHRR